MNPSIMSHDVIYKHTGFLWAPSLSLTHTILFTDTVLHIHYYTYLSSVFFFFNFIVRKYT